MNNIQLFNNDCLEEMKNIDDKSIDLIITDLPYCGITNSKKDSEIACKWNTPIDLELMWKEFKRIRKDTTPIIFTCSTKFGYSLIESNKKEFRYDMVWVKSLKVGFFNSKRIPLRSHEMVYIFYKKCPSETYGNNIKKYHKNKYLDEEKNHFNTENENKVYGNNRKYRARAAKLYEPGLPNSILEISSQKKLHPTQKPTGLSDFFIKYYSNEGDTILDNCMGSGSFGVSAINLNRKFIGIEKDEDIFNIAKNRIEKELERINNN